MLRTRHKKFYDRVVAGPPSVGVGPKVGVGVASKVPARSAPIGGCPYGRVMPVVRQTLIRRNRRDTSKERREPLRAQWHHIAGGVLADRAREHMPRPIFKRTGALRREVVPLIYPCHSAQLARLMRQQLVGHD